MRDAFLKDKDIKCKTIYDFSNFVNEKNLSFDYNYSFLFDYFNESKSDRANFFKEEENNPLQQIIIDQDSSNNFSKEVDRKTSSNESCSDVPVIFRDNLRLLNEIYKYIKIVDGDVNYPGLYFVRKENYMTELLRFAGSNSSDYKVSNDERFVNIGMSSIKIQGSVNRPSVIKASKNIFISEILSPERVFTEKTHPFFGIIIRDIENKYKEYITFNPTLATEKNEFDIQILPNDIIKLFDIDMLTSAITKISQISENINSYNIEDNKTDNIGDYKYIDNNPNSQEKSSELKTDSSITPSQFLNAAETEVNNLKVGEENETFKNYTTDNISNDDILNNDKTFENFNEKLYVEICKDFDEWVSGSLFQCKKFINILKSSIIDIRGQVKNPGVYVVGGFAELNDVIKFTGGYTSHADKNNVEISNNRFGSVLRGNNLISKTNPQGSYKGTLKGANLYDKFIGPGGKAFVNELSFFNSFIELSGHFKYPRTIKYQRNFKLSDFIYKSNVNNSTYMYFATITKNSSSLEKKILIPFSPIDVINGFQNYNLDKNDVISLYSRNEISEILKKFSIQGNTKTPLLNFDKKNNLPLISGDIKKLVIDYLI